jgi:hypothetical protein
LIAILHILTIAIPIFALFRLPRFFTGLRSGSYDQGRLHLDRRSDPIRYKCYMALFGLSYVLVGAFLIESVIQTASYFSN